MDNISNNNAPPGDTEMPNPETDMESEPVTNRHNNPDLTNLTDDNINNNDLTNLTDANIITLTTDIDLDPVGRNITNIDREPENDKINDIFSEVPDTLKEVSKFINDTMTELMICDN